MGQGWRSFGWVSLAGLTFTLGVVGMRAAGWLEGFSGFLLDVRMRTDQRFSPPISDAIVHVDIDDDSTKVIGRWPWDREILAMAIDEMRRCGATTIVLDILLDEPQAPRLAVNERNEVIEIEDDALLADAIAESGGVLVGVNIAPADEDPVETEGDGFELEMDGAPDQEGAAPRRAEMGAGDAHAGADLIVEWPVDVIRDAAQGVGFVNVPTVEGVRRVSAWVDVEGEPRLYQLGVRATAAYLGVPESELSGDASELRVGDSIRVGLRDGSAIIPWRPRDEGEATPWIQRKEPKSWERIHPRVPIQNFIRMAQIRRQLRGAVGILTVGAPLDRDVTAADLDAADETAAFLMEDYGAKSPAEVLAELPADAPNETVNALRAIAALPSLRRAFEEYLPRRQAEMEGILGGKLVFVGYVGTGAVADFYPTAMGVKTPGVCVHSSMANGLLTGHWIRRAPTWLDLLVTFLAGLTATLVASALPPNRGWIAALILTGVYVVFNAVIVFDLWNTWLALGGPLIAAVGSWATCTTIQAIQERKAKAAVRRQFRARVSAQLVDYLSEHPDMINMDGEERELTIAFTDFVGFTSISEQLEGKQTVAILNRYLRAMTDVMLDHTAYVNKFLGDGIMAFWGAPALDPKHASSACLAVVDCFDALDMLNEAPEFEGLPKLGMRAGISTGTVIVGDCGAPPRLNDYTVIGDAVNLAARLESANKMLGTRALVTQRTMDLMDDDSKARIVWRPLGKLRVVGQQQLTPVYELVARSNDPELTDEVRDWVKRTREAVELFEAGKVEESMEIWQDLVLFERGSAGALLYTERCAELLESKREDYFLPLRSK